MLTAENIDWEFDPEMKPGGLLPFIQDVTKTVAKNHD